MTLTPNLYRVTVTSLIVALAANVFLWKVSATDDIFANIIAIASGLAAIVLLATAVIPRAVGWREEALLVTFAVWTANLIEFAFETDARWESRARQCGLYAALAVLALGTYIGQRVAHAHTESES